MEKDDIVHRWLHGVLSLLAFPFFCHLSRAFIFDTEDVSTFLIQLLQLMAFPKDIKVREDVCRLIFFRDLCSEFLGSFFMVLFVAFLMVNLNEEVYQPSTLHAGITMGLNIFILIEALGPISGCHINPAVSLAWCLSGRISVVRGKYGHYPPFVLKSSYITAISVCLCWLVYF